MTTLNIAAGTYPAATRTFGPVAVPVNTTHGTITLDLASYPSNQTVFVAVDASYDGGTTWVERASKTQPGGTLPADGGTTTTNYFLSVDVGGDPSSSLRRVRARITNSAPLTTTGGSVVTA